MEKIKTALKAVVIFFIMYVIISGNGDDTFFAWIIMGISIVLTKLFLDESKNIVCMLWYIAMLILFYRMQRGTRKIF